MNDPTPRERAIAALTECGYTEQQAIEMLASVRREAEAEANYRSDVIEQIG